MTYTHTHAGDIHTHTHTHTYQGDIHTHTHTHTHIKVTYTHTHTHTCRCEAGDLEGKFGSLSPDGQVDVVDDTGDLNLSGRYSIVGRHIHDNVDSTVHLACSTIRLLNQKEGMYYKN